MICLDKFSALPAGTSLLFDTNIFVYWALDHPRFGEACEKLVERVNDQDIEGSIPSVVLNEMLHRLMIAEVIGNHWVAQPLLAVRLLKNDPAIIPQLKIPWKVFRTLMSMNFKVLEEFPGITQSTFALSKTYSLLAKDAAILAYAKKFKISSIATNDSDFARVPWLTCWKP
ncbi:MAG: PIN domain-containing protein [Methanoregula sp.]|nr:PIN domain-containing protein [Methanoregula sp.]